MKVGVWPLLPLTLTALALVALAACARSTPPRGVGTSAGPPTSTALSGASSAPSTASSTAPGTRMPGSPCPTETVLDPGTGAGSGARDGAIAAAEAAVPQRYPPHIDITGYRVTGAYAADPSSGYGAIPYGLCGADVGQRTWVVELAFPRMAPSVDLSAGQLFLSRFPDGWKVWFQYH